MSKKVFYYETIDSTNIQAARLAKEGAKHGCVVIAKEQTAGKGRRGREWESPKDENIYMSILLRPEMEPSKAPMLTLVMAYSVARSLCKKGFDNVQIKWPNDVIIGGKKICGILTEMELAGNEISHVVIGVGINVNTKGFSKELKEKATSLYLESGKIQEMEELQKDIMETFWADYEQFVTDGDLSFLKESYNRILVNQEREVRVLEPGHEYTAYAVGINNNGELLVRTADGEEHAIYAGEVSVRGVYGYI